MQAIINEEYDVIKSLKRLTCANMVWSRTLNILYLPDNSDIVNIGTDKLTSICESDL